MYCTKCGNELKEDAKFCSKCGTATSNNASVSNNAYGRTGTVSFDNSYLIIALIVANIVTACSTLFSIFTVPLAESLLGSSGSSFSFMTVTKIIIKLTNDERGSLSGTGVLFYLIMILVYILAIACVVEIIIAIATLLRENTKDSYVKREILDKLRAASILALVQLGSIFVGKTILTWAEEELKIISFSFWFYFLIVVAIVSLIFEKQVYENIQQEKSKEVILKKNDDTWVCNCGTRNPNSQKFCSSCSKSKTNEPTYRLKTAYKNDSWVCNCGTRNPSSQKYCKNCSKAKPNY